MIASVQGQHELRKGQPHLQNEKKKERNKSQDARKEEVWEGEKEEVKEKEMVGRKERRVNLYISIERKCEPSHRE